MEAAAQVLTSSPDRTIRFSASPEELAATGKALRERVPRASHGEWKLRVSRSEPLDILRAADADRLPHLVPIRYGRMLVSPFTFFRGSAGIMAADLAQTPKTGVVVQACGDCHLKNFGGFATPERAIVFDINDFDETLPAPWEWDVKRLAASFILAARSNGLSDRSARKSAVVSARAYRTAMRNFSQMSPLELWYQRFGTNEFFANIPDPRIKQSIEQRIKKASAKGGSDSAYPKLAQVIAGEIHIRDNPPLIYHPEETRDPEFRSKAEEILKNYHDTLADDRRILLDHYRFVDAVIKVVGVGSVGTRCWIALLMSASNSPLFLQLKQATASVLEPYAGKSAYSHSGQRVVMGQRLMQAASDMFLGWTTTPGGDFYVRQLRDAKVSPLVETFDAVMLTLYANLCGQNLARAHAKTGNAWTISGYLGKSDEFDEAIGDFAEAYADQAEADHAVLQTAVRSGKVAAYTE
jgi:uncharacterized protein (DUF2252 family)